MPRMQVFREGKCWLATNVMHNHHLGWHSRYEHQYFANGTPWWHSKTEHLVIDVYTINQSSWRVPQDKSNHIWLADQLNGATKNYNLTEVTLLLPNLFSQYWFHRFPLSLYSRSPVIPIIIKYLPIRLSSRRQYYRLNPAQLSSPTPNQRS